MADYDFTAAIESIAAQIQRRDREIARKGEVIEKLSISFRTAMTASPSWKRS
jgi:hypothetical protein